MLARCEGIQSSPALGNADTALDVSLPCSTPLEFRLPMQLEGLVEHDGAVTSPSPGEKILAESCTLASRPSTSSDPPAPPISTASSSSSPLVTAKTIAKFPFSLSPFKRKLAPRRLDLLQEGATQDRLAAALADVAARAAARLTPASALRLEMTPRPTTGSMDAGGASGPAAASVAASSTAPAPSKPKRTYKRKVKPIDAENPGPSEPPAADARPGPPKKTRAKSKPRAIQPRPVEQDEIDKVKAAAKADFAISSFSCPAPEGKPPPTVANGPAPVLGKAPRKKRGPVDEATKLALALSRSMMKEQKRKRPRKANPAASSVLPACDALKIVLERLESILLSVDRRAVIQAERSGPRDLFLYPAACFEDVAVLEVDDCVLRWHDDEAAKSDVIDAIEGQTIDGDCHKMEIEAVDGPAEHQSAATRADDPAPGDPVSPDLLAVQEASLHSYYDELLKAKETELDAHIEGLLASHRLWVAQMLAERDAKLEELRGEAKREGLDETETCQARPVTGLDCEVVALEYAVIEATALKPAAPMSVPLAASPLAAFSNATGEGHVVAPAHPLAVLLSSHGLDDDFSDLD